MKISFKDFLREEPTKPWELSDEGEKDAAGLKTFMDANIPNWKKLCAFEGNCMIFRGFKDHPSSSKFGVLKIDSSNAKRVSRDTNNVYQLMMDASSDISDYPSRSKAIIGSTSIETANIYAADGGKDSVFILFPAEGVKIAVASENDFLSTPFLPYAYSISPFTDRMGAVLQSLRGDKTFIATAPFHSLDEANALCASAGAGAVAVAFESMMRGGPAKSNDGKINVYVGHPEEFYAQLDEIEKAYNAGLFDIAPKYQEAVDVIVAAPRNKRFSALSDFLMTEDRLGLSLRSFGNGLGRGRREVWFSGKCIAIPVTVFRDMVLAYDDIELSVELRSELKAIKGK